MTDVQQLKQSIDLTRLVDTSMLSKPMRSGEHIGPCPKCGGNDRFSLWPDHFFCRQCKPPTKGRAYDCIEFCQWYYGDDFKAALDRLGGGSFRVEHAPAATKRISEPKDFNHTEAAKSADEYHRQLTGGKDYAQKAVDYLRKRMINDDTIEAFNVGLSLRVSLPQTWDRENKRHVHPKQPAIAIPWYDRGGACVGIRYRFLETHTYSNVDGEERTAKKSSLYNSTFRGGYGWHTLRGAKYLVIIEGEINAMSVWQCRQDVDVLSVGSETSFNSLSESMLKFIAGYEKVLVWADKRSVANEAALAIGAHSYVDPDEKDANDRLCHAQLRRILDYIFPDVQSTDLEARTDSLQLRTDDALAEVDELLSTREPLPDDGLATRDYGPYPLPELPEDASYMIFEDSPEGAEAARQCQKGLPITSKRRRLGKGAGQYIVWYLEN